jgi:hypothetical protein
MAAIKANTCLPYGGMFVLPPPKTSPVNDSMSEIYEDFELLCLAQ